MLDINFIRENPDIVRKSLHDRNMKADIVDDFLSIDSEWRALEGELGRARAKLNELSRARNIEEAKLVKDTVKKLEEDTKIFEKKREGLLYSFPNIPKEDVPVGKDASENKVLRSWAEPPKFDFDPKDHIALGESLGILDTEKASKISGARFAYLKGALALLEIALVSYAFSILTSKKELEKIAKKFKKTFTGNPFIPVIPPAMIRPEVFTSMARLSEEDKDERYYLPADDLYLIGSAEHTLGPLHMDETLSIKEMPIRYVGFSSSFRREAGSYGKDTKGILRVHQFDKVEIESFTTMEKSDEEHEFIVAIQEYFMQSLEIPYRVVLLSTGDMGKPDARQIDIESWMPGQGRYRETHSADLMGDYQARRLKTKIKDQDGKTKYAAMVDATVFAIGRTLIAILENYQTEKGTVKIPKVLQKYTGFKEITRKI